MTSTDNLISLLNQLQTMESTVTDFLMETVLRFQTLTNSKVFLLIESGGKDRQRRYCGAQELVDEYVQERPSHKSTNSFVQLDPNVNVLIESRENQELAFSQLNHNPNDPEPIPMKKRKVNPPSCLRPEWRSNREETTSSAKAHLEVNCHWSCESAALPVLKVKEETDNFAIIDDFDDTEDSFVQSVSSYQDFKHEQPITPSDPIGATSYTTSAMHNQGQTYTQQQQPQLLQQFNSSANGVQSECYNQKLDPNTDPNGKDRSDRPHSVTPIIDRQLLGALASKNGGKRNRRKKKAKPLNPIPLFDDPIPPREAFEFDRVIFMPSQLRRPLLVFQGNIFRIKRSPASSGRTAWWCINQEKTQCPAKMYTTKCWPCRPEDVEHNLSILDHSCSSTMKDVYERRANAEMVYMAKKTVQDALGDEPDHILSLV